MLGQGPPFPPPPPNFIGGFVIGRSQIGTIPPFSLWSTIITQYANSGTLTSLIESWFAALDQTADFDQFYDLIMNVATAQGYGLDVWGRIVGVQRTLQVSNSENLGFEEAGEPGIGGFNQDPFYAGGAVTANYTLTDAAFRTLIYAKAMANICSGSIPAINAVLLALFPGAGECYVTDGQNMTMTYTFNFALTPLQEAIIFQSGVLPRPAGVAASIVVNP